MAINNFKKSERKKMLESVNTKLKLSEKRIKMLMQVLGTNDDTGMSRVYSAFISKDPIVQNK